MRLYILLYVLLCVHTVLPCDFAYVGGIDALADVIRLNLETENIDSIPIPNSVPEGFAFTPDGLRLYVTDSFNEAIYIIDTTNNELVDTINFSSGSDPVGIAISPDGLKAYVVMDGFDTVSVIDISTQNITATIPVGVAPLNIAITPDGAKAYVTGNPITAINLATNVPTPIPAAGHGSGGIAVTPDGTTVYATRGGLLFNDVIRIDVATDTVIGAPITVGLSPIFLAITHDGSKVFVSNNASSTVSVIDTSTNQEIAEIAIAGAGLGQIAIDCQDTIAYVTDSLNGVVYPITIANNSVGDPIPALANAAIIAIFFPSSIAFTGVIKCIRYINRIENVLTMQWGPSTLASATYFGIYRNGVLIALIPVNDSRTFVLRLNNCNEAQGITLVQLDASGLIIGVPSVLRIV
jgi:YVTN family beta-propeller protein